ncbi:MAG: hypothetical protein AAFQ62_05360 [Pseudomonadota bacterium]
MSSRAVVWLLVVGIVLFVIGRVMFGSDGNTGDASDHIDAQPVEPVDANEVGKSIVDNARPAEPVVGALATEKETPDLGDGEPFADSVAAVENEQAAVATPTDEEAIQRYGSVTSWQLHLLESEDRAAFPEWIDEQFEAGLDDYEKSADNAEMINAFLLEASSHGYDGQPIVECSAMICRLEFTGANDMRALTKLIGQGAISLPDQIAGFHGLRRGPNGELIIFAPLKGILGVDR